MRTVLAALASLVATTVGLCFPLLASASIVTFNLNGTFDDGGSLSGTLSLAFGETQSCTIDALTSATADFGSKTYTGACNAPAGLDSNLLPVSYSLVFTNYVGSTSQLLLRFDGGLFADSSSVPFVFGTTWPDASGELGGVFTHPVRFLTSGSVSNDQVGSVPEPGSLALLVLGLALLAAPRFRKR